MIFQFQPKITKDLILSKFSEEQIMEYYLNIPVRKGLFRSPLRRDRQPTCSFYRNNSGTLIFKDFATGQHLNVFDIVQCIYKCNYFEALRIIANDLNIINDKTLHKNNGKINLNPIKIKDKEVSKIQIEIQDFADNELKWWGKYGITLDILKKFNVYSCKHVFLNNNLFATSQQHCPIFGYYGGKIQDNKEKIELWRIYFPKRKTYRFVTNWPSKKIQGFNQLPKKGKLLVITKSMKDCMCLHSCGISACAPNSENLFISDKVLEDLKQRFKYIVVLYDNDRPGQYNMAKIRKAHPELIYTFIPKEYRSKDISDFYKDHGRKETINLIKNFVLWLRNREN